MSPDHHRSAFRAAAIVGALAFTASICADQPAAQQVREALDLPYADGKDRHRLDVFSPAQPGKAPVVLFLHGGAWMFGDKDLFGMYRSVGQFLARHGFVAVLANYRLSPTVQHPEHVKDAAR